MIEHIQIFRTAPGHTTQLPGILITALLAIASISGPAAAVEKGDFKAPSLDGFTMTSEENADGDGDGLKETHVKHYSSEMGDRLFSMSTKGMLWAWSLQSHAGPKSENNYVIRDGDCDGVFDERYQLDEEFHVPDCLSYSRHP